MNFDTLVCFSKKRKQRFSRYFFVILLLFLTIETLDAQSSQKITISLHNISMQHFIETLEKKSGYKISYRDAILKGKAPVTIDAKNDEVDQILRKVLTERGLQFTKKDNTIVITESIKEKPKKIKGLVKDDLGSPLIGANVKIKGIGAGTITDMNGQFELEAANDAVLEISYIGFVAQEVPVANKTSIDVLLQENKRTLDEVVVVGYGTQKKLNITGAIDVISSKTLEKLPVSNITQALQGTVPGLVVTDGGGKPGSALRVNVRGTGTLGNTDPLVVIDGIPTGLGDFNILNSNDIESISVLKDASSAAIYGSRAANGVLVVTTKKGSKERKPVINVGYSYSAQTPTKVPDMLNSWEYAELRNEALTQSSKAPQFTADQIELMRNGTDPDNYANINWWNEAVKKNNNMQQLNVSISGGNKSTTYMISGGATWQDGLIDYTDFNKFNARATISTEIADNVDIVGSVSFYRENSQVPYNFDRFFGEVMNMAPYIPVKKQNGDWGHLNNETTNPVAWIQDGGYRRSHDDNLNMTLAADWEIFKGFKLRGQGAYNFWTPGHTEISRTIEFINEDNSVSKSNDPNGNSRQFIEKSLFVYQFLADYQVSIENNNIHALVGYSDENYKSSWVGGWRQLIPDNEMEEIDGATGSGTKQGSWGASDEWQMRSYFGRVNYDYAGKYFLEANARYDGSSRLSPGHQYTFFPSGSIGWRISEENFMSFSRDYFDNIKLRASYGQLGNQAIGLYQYAEVIKTNPKDYMFGHQWVAGSHINSLPNSEITWEVSTILDLGLDVNCFNSRLTGSFDWYKKNTNGILLDVPVSSVIGLPVSVQNAGRMTNWGWEIQLGWKDSYNKFNYGATFSLSDQKNKVLDLKGTGPFIGNSTITTENHPLNTLYAYVADGFYTSEQDIKNSPKIEGYTDQLKVGDIKYKDLSGPDGKPDGKVDSYDREYVGWSAPRYMYGLDLTAEWKGFDARIFIQGVGKREEYVLGQVAYMSGGFKHIQEERWSPYKTVEQNISEAKYPRLSDGEENNYVVSTFWLHNAAYLRLKNLQIGYTLPKHVTKKASLERVRFYVSGNNLLTLTKFPYIDPEGGNGGAYYPQLRTFSIGVDITIGKN